MKNNKKAFTLIELLVVVLIIGILSAVALPQYTFAVEKARIAEAMTNAASLQKAIDVWLLENGGYPENYIKFLGNNDNGAGLLVVDLENGMDCDMYEGTECGGKNFAYDAWCGPGFCYIWIARLINGDRDNVPYILNWGKEENGWHGDECDYYTDVSPIGEKLCRMLEKQGNGFFACENC